MKLTYSIVRSSRRTLALQVKDGCLIVRAPYAVANAEIERFVAQHRTWAEAHLNEAEQRRQELNVLPPLLPSEIKELAAEAQVVIPLRVAHYAALLGVSYGKITVRAQKTRWGSCSAKGNLNFNCLLMLAPREVLDSVVVHELCHRKEMNHSKRFYQTVLSVYPDYHKHHAWLREHGTALLDRMSRGME